ncbi:MAG: DEAD/DEAH box helicase [Candidatus Tectimicrobiota bacterium]
MQAGYLVDLRAVQVLLQADFDALHTTHGDFVEAELETLLLAAKAPTQVLAAFQAHAADRKALLFTPTVALASAMAATFRTAGIAAEALDGTTPLATRRAMLQRLHTGATRVVANCAVLTEGFDEPSVDCIIVARPTQSALLYQQMLGRGTRTYPGKTDCLLLDVVGVSTRHTLYTAATLFACDPARLAQQSVLAILDGPACLPQDTDPVTGTLRSTPVDLFARRALRWVQTRQGGLGPLPGRPARHAAAPGRWPGDLAGAPGAPRRRARPAGRHAAAALRAGVGRRLCAASGGGAAGGDGSALAAAAGHGETDGAAAQAGDRSAGGAYER